MMIQLFSSTIDDIRGKMSFMIPRAILSDDKLSEISKL